MNDIKMLSVSLESAKFHEGGEAYIHIPEVLMASPHQIRVMKSGL